MLEIQTLRQNPESASQALSARGVPNATEAIKNIVAQDDQRKKILTDLEALRYEMNQSAASIGQLKKAGKHEEATQAINRTGDIKSEMKTLEQQLSEVKEATYTLLVTLPNIPHPSVPTGKDAADNVVVAKNEISVSFDFTPLPHWDLARKHDIIDWELGSKISGAGFPVYKGKGARLQRALIAFFLDRAVDAGFMEIQPPLLVNEESGFGTGQLPDKDGQMYFAEKDGLYLIPTAEVPITNLYRDMILNAADLPVKNCGYTPCFRREAGSYGKDVKGLNRLHQFDKVEMVTINLPGSSYEQLERMTEHSESLLTALELPFHRLLLCTGDMSFASAKTYDLEVFSAGQERWLEVSSISNFETFQANRLKLRYKDEDKKTRLLHTLNGSALALPRIVAALLENNQQADQSIRIPTVLQSYTGFDQIG